MSAYACNLIHEEPSLPPKGGDWLSYYSSFLDVRGFRDYIAAHLNGVCPACGQAPIEVGAVVGFLSWENRRAYLVPLCRCCRSVSGSFLSLPDALLCVPFPADVSTVRYPEYAIAHMRANAPEGASLWDGHPISTVSGKESML